MRITGFTIASVLFAALLSAPAFCQPDDGLTIFVPESLTDVSPDNKALIGSKRAAALMSAVSTTGKKVVLVGKVKDYKNVEMDVINNERSHVAPTMHNGYFHARVVLSLGVNLIDIRWRKAGGNWETKTLSIFRSSKLENGLTSNYPPYIFHREENEEHCQECHQMRLTRSETETGMEKGCLKCHHDLTENVYVHGPVNVGVCTVCHDPESRPNKYKVQEDDKVLCYSCHEDRKKVDEKKKLLHGPVGAGMCVICHDPHSSPFEFQLVKAKSEICLLCHQEDASRWSQENSLHPPFKSGNCSGCHDPHSSDYKYNLKADREDICALCHDLPVPGHLHRVGRVPQFKLPDDFPLTDEGKTMCLTCHDPHGAQGQRLTRRDGCEGCHPK